MSDTSRLAFLFNKYSSNTCSPEELAEFWALLQETREEDILPNEMLALWNKERSGVLASDSVDWKFLQDRMQVEMRQVQSENIALENPRVRTRRVHLMRRWLAAAAILFLLATGAFFWINSYQGKTEVATALPMDIAPGKDGAVLTLADGTKLVLDSMGNGILATQNGAKVTLQNGQVIYNADHLPLTTSHSPAYNTMSTPKGRQFQLLLPDGTKVWLNAASSITYPTFFAGKERRVQVSGEVYFEVTKDRKLPFRVDVNKQATIEVLGTHFNVNAYSNETFVKTTLLEGSVKIVNRESLIGNSESEILKPGEQAVLTHDSRLTIHDNTDIDKVMAWKNGFFNFEGVPITQVMKQIERWYDITVVYEKGVPNIEFFGELNRNFSLSELIEALKDVGVRFRIEEGRKLVVLP